MFGGAIPSSRWQSAPMPDASATPLQSLLAAVVLGDGAPEWIHLVPAGTIPTVDDRGPFVLADPQGVVDRSMSAGSKLPVDENHSTDLAGPRGEPSPARGWIVEMQTRADGIWGRVEWNASGRSLLADRAYRGISPVITHFRDGTIHQVLRASLTNRPNLVGLTALNADQGTDQMDLLADLRRLLGLADTADAAAVIAAVKAKTSDAACSAEVRTAFDGVAKIVGLEASGSTAPGAVVTAVAALGDPKKFVTIEAHTALQSELARLKEAGGRAKAEAFIDGKIREGRVGLKPLRDHYVTRHMAEPEAVEKEIAAMPTIHSTGPGGEPTRISTLSAEASPDEIIAAATLHQAEAEKKGVVLTFAQAVRAVTPGEAR